MSNHVWLTRQEAAAIAQVSVRTIDRWIRLGWLKAGGPGRLVRIREDWLEECLAARAEGSPA